jgi:hypothetical protein
MSHRRLISERDLVRRAATRDLPRTPVQLMVRALVRIAVLFIVSAVVWLFVVLAFHLEVPSP